MDRRITLVRIRPTFCSNPLSIHDKADTNILMSHFLLHLICTAEHKINMDVSECVSNSHDIWKTNLYVLSFVLREESHRNLCEAFIKIDLNKKS